MKQSAKKFVSFSASLCIALAFINGSVSYAENHNAASSSDFSNKYTEELLSPEIDFGEEGDAILKVYLRDILLTDGLFAIIRNGEVFLPLGELSALLDLPILVDPVSGTASGWFLEPANIFALDIRNGSVEVIDKLHAFNEEDVFSDDIDLFVRSTLLSRWLPLFFDVSLSAQILQVRSSEKLPKELARERSERKKFKEVTFAATKEYNVPEYRLLDWPELSLDFGSFYSSDSGNGQFDYRVRAIGDFAFLNGRVGISGNQSNITGATMTLGRSDPRGMFGPLRVADFELGDTSQFLPGLIGSSLSGRGVRFGNTRLANRRDLDTIDLQGEQQAGFEVEVYVNDRLRDVDRDSDDNLYNFQDVPLQLGPNEIRLEFYGPQGQRSTEVQRNFVGGGRGKQGSFTYEFAVVEPGLRVFDLFEEVEQSRDNGGLSDFRHSSALNLSYGLTSRTSLGLTMASLAANNDNESASNENIDEDNLLYTGARVTTELQGVLLSSDLTVDPNGKLAGALYARTSIGNYELGASQRVFQKNFRNTVNIDSADTNNLAKLESAGNLSREFFAVPGGRFSYGSSASYQQNQSGDESLTLGARADYLNSLVGLSWSHNYSYDLDDSTNKMNGRIGARLNVGDLTRWSLSSDWSYSDSGDQLLSSGSLRAGRPLGADGNLSLSATRDLQAESTFYSAAWNRQFKPLSLSTSIGGSSFDDISVRVGFELTARRVPNRLLPAISSSSRGGSVAVVVFGDENQNGKQDDFEPVLKGVRLTRNGLLSEAATDSNGVALLSGLAINSSVDIGILESDIKEPGLKYNGIDKGILVRPGRVPVISVALQPATDVEGTVVITGGDNATPVPNVRMVLVPIDGGEPLEVRTEYDGYYYLAHVPLGVYDFGPDAEQLKSAGLVAQPASRRLDLRELKDFPPPEDFNLRRLADLSTSSEPEVAAAHTSAVGTLIDADNTRGEPGIADEEVYLVRCYQVTFKEQKVPISIPSRPQVQVQAQVQSKSKPPGDLPALPLYLGC